MNKATKTIAPHCAGGCGAQVDDASQKDKHWLVLLGVIGQPAYYFCNDCEVKDAELIERQLGPVGREAGCTGMVRLETGSPREIIGMIQDIPAEEGEE